MDKNKIKFYIKEYFTFSKGEKVGILVLVSIIILIIAFSCLIPLLIKPTPKIDVSEFEKEIARFEQTSDSLKSKTSFFQPIKDSLKKKKYNSAKQIINVELNTVDSVSLEKLPGIGPVLAGRIIKYRTILGGYHSPDQLSQVYGIKPDLLERVGKYLTADTLKIRKIDVNTAEFKEINAHPYISFPQAKLIMKSRSRGKILSLAQLEKDGIFSMEELAKLKPYLLIK
jgi:DNA uptake protein ComE-like DNA-binding protein